MCIGRKPNSNRYVDTMIFPTFTPLYSPSLLPSNNEVYTDRIHSSSSTYNVKHNVISRRHSVTKTNNYASNVKKSSKVHNEYPRLIVKHDYHDHSKDPCTQVQQSVSDDDNSESPKVIHSSSNPFHNNGVGSTITSFPMKLYEVLEILTNDEYESNIISWQPHGRCFVISQPDLFKSIILPKYFHLDKIQSFQRNLNLYGFKRITQGKDKNSYYHELFLRGRIDLSLSMQRKKIKGTNIRAKSNPEDEPDFWDSFPWMSTVQMCENEVKDGEDDNVQPEVNVSSVNVSSSVSDDSDKDDSIMDENFMNDNTDFDEDEFQSKILELVFDVDALNDLYVGNNTSSRITQFSDLDSVLSNSEYFQQSFLFTNNNNCVKKEYQSEHNNNNNHVRLHGWGKPFYCINDNVKNTVQGFNGDYII